MGKKSRQAENLSSADAVVKALYESISFTQGNQSDYDRLRSLFHPGAKISPPKDNANSPHPVLDVESFIGRLQEQIILNGLDTKGFMEREIHRTIEAFGDIVHVFSTYESRNASDKTLIGRGVNSIQLIRDEQRWWVLSIMWDREREENSIPQNYLP